MKRTQISYRLEAFPVRFEAWPVEIVGGMLAKICRDFPTITATASRHSLVVELAADSVAFELSTPLKARERLDAQIRLHMTPSLRDAIGIPHACEHLDCEAAPFLERAGDWYCDEHIRVVEPAAEGKT